METSVKNTVTGCLAFRLYYDGRAFLKFLKYILRKSIYEYYFTLKYNSEENNEKFTIKQLDKIIADIESKWVKNA